MSIHANIHSENSWFGGDRKAELKQQALADSSVQAMLDVFAAEIRDVEEIDGKS